MDPSHGRHRENQAHGYAGGDYHDRCRPSGKPASEIGRSAQGTGRQQPLENCSPKGSEIDHRIAPAPREEAGQTSRRQAAAVIAVFLDPAAPVGVLPPLLDRRRASAPTKRLDRELDELGARQRSRLFELTAQRGVEILQPPPSPSRVGSGVVRVVDRCPLLRLTLDHRGDLSRGARSIGGHRAIVVGVPDGLAPGLWRPTAWRSLFRSWRTSDRRCPCQAPRYARALDRIVGAHATPREESSQVIGTISTYLIYLAAGEPAHRRGHRGARRRGRTRLRPGEGDQDDGWSTVSRCKGSLAACTGARRPRACRGVARTRPRGASLRQRGRSHRAARICRPGRLRPNCPTRLLRALVQLTY
jgi:hypothetical protein